MALLSLGTCATAQTFTVLVNFSGGDGANPGANPQAGLVASGGTLYGTTYAGGSPNFGTVFSVNTNGNDFTNLYSFNGATYDTNTETYVPADGANPSGELVLSGNMLYGTTSAGGSSNEGTVFAINTNGGGYAILYSFPGLSHRLRSNWATTPRRDEESMVRTCDCWSEGNTSTRRSTVLRALLVCKVPKTRRPVSAAVSAREMVSRSRISPTRTMSASSRKAAFRPAGKSTEWSGTSRWVMMLRLLLCDELDRLLDGDDVPGIVDVDVVHHARQASCSCRNPSGR